MSKADESVMVRCDCTGMETILTIDRWRFPGEPEANYVEFYSHAGSALPLVDRLKLVWRILRRREHYLDVVLLSPEDAKRLGRFLLEAK